MNPTTTPSAHSAAELAPALRTKHITYAVRDIVLVAREAQAAGKQLLYLNIGDPNQFDFDTPKHVLDAIINDGLLGRKNGYCPSEGVPAAVEAIRREAQRKGIKPVIDVFTGNGASEPIEIALTALVNSGDNVLTPSPGYPLYTAVLAKLGVESNPYYLDESADWQPDPDDIESRINAKTRALVLINPNNPTGSVASRETLQRIVDICIRHNLVLFSDEIYDKLLFDGVEHISPGSLSEDLMCLTFNGLSKSYFGPGLRMGWCISSGPQKRMTPFIGAMHQLTRARLCASSPVQYGIPAALDGDHGFLQTELAKLQRRRDITFERLNAIPGISCVKPRGAFYAFPRIEIGDQDDMEWVKQVIYETGVVIVHGSGFGQKPSTKHVRVVFLPPDDVLETSYQKLADFMAQRTR